MNKLLLLLFLIFNINTAVGAERMLHPDYPVVEGVYKMTSEWYVTLAEKYNHRIEDGSLVLWRPGVTVWVNVWNNDNKESMDERLEWTKSKTSSNAYDVMNTKNSSTYLHGYRLNEESDGKTTLAYYGSVIAKDDSVQVAVYFDAESDFSVAQSIVESISNVQP